ncbi:MAG: Barrel-sandwich domain of CusB or HlyD rane-fusion [Pseudomonadota bacterium]|jgi:multidrug efflux system membrane fusion protein
MRQYFYFVSFFSLLVFPTTQALAKTPCVTRQELTARSTGIVQRYHASNGDVVKKGEPIIEFDSRLLRAGFKEAQAAVDAAKGNEELAADALVRLEKLQGSEAVTAQQLAEAKIRVSQARALRRQAEAAAERVKVQLDDTVLKAEVGGRVQGLPTILGMVVQVGQSLGSIEVVSPSCSANISPKNN